MAALDKLRTINDALIATGNEPVNVEFDGSDEWIAADSGYQRALRELLSMHRWNFGTTTGSISAQPASNPSQVYDYAYIPPADCLHIEAVFKDGGAVTAYEIVDSKVCCNVPGGVQVKYVRTPPDAQFSPLFLEALTVLTESHLYRSLNEDLGEARRRAGDAEVKLQSARTLSDQEEGAKVVMRSRSAARRRGGSRV